MMYWLRQHSLKLVVLILLVFTMIDGYNGYLTKDLPVSVPTAINDQIQTTPVNTSTSGELLSELRITKSGKIIPFVGDWNSFDAKSFSYGGTKVKTNITNYYLNLTGIAVRDYFAKGDKIRLVQGGNTKYFYVYGIADTLGLNELWITGGSSYALTTEEITELSSSKLPSPSGFPGYMNHTSTLHAYQQAFTISNQGTQVSYFTLEGEYCNWTLSRVDFQVSATNDYYVQEDPPIQPYLPGGSLYFPIMGRLASASSFDMRNGNFTTYVSDTDGYVLDINRYPYAVYTGSANTSHYVTVSFRY